VTEDDQQSQAGPAPTPAAPRPAQEPDELVGTFLGSYRVTQRLGKGGMGAVYLGEHPVIGSKVAIKVLHPQFAEDKKVVDRFFDEARAVNLIGHHHIVKILDLDVSPEGRHFFVMEYLEGKPLGRLMRKGQPMPLEVAGPILLQICAALEAAHAKKIIHRDLKPDNVFLISHQGRKNYVKLVDFGIAKLLEVESTTGRTETGAVMGTPAYMSPEQALGEGSRIDARSDVYALGVLMFQLATGQLPFNGTHAKILLAHVQSPTPRPRSLNPALPKRWEAIILEAMEKQPENRFEGAGQLGAAITGCLESLGLATSPPMDDGAAVAEGGQPPVPTPQATPLGSVVRSLGAGALFGGNEESASGVSRSGLSPGRRRRQKRQQQLLLGGAAGVLVLGAAAFALLHRGPPAPRQGPAAATAAPPVGRASAAPDRTAEPAPPPSSGPAPAKAEVKLMVLVENAEQVEVEATWEGGKAAAQTPCRIAVPKGALVRLRLSKGGFETKEVSLTANTPSGLQAVSERLEPAR
jgi:tRNA A-37 threonylcarbamoyl transferase component Bud32